MWIIDKQFNMLGIVHINLSKRTMCQNGGLNERLFLFMKQKKNYWRYIVSAKLVSVEHDTVGSVSIDLAYYDNTERFFVHQAKYFILKECWRKLASSVSESN